MSIKMLLKLMRFKPVFAWAVCGFLLSLSVAYYETGMLQNVDALILSFIAVILIQSVLSHAINDLCDEEVDRDADIENTGRTKVLLNGMAKRSDLMRAIAVVLMLLLFTILIMYNRFGYMIIVFAYIGLYAAVCYSVSPLKLGWKPFAEFTVVLPVIVTLVVAVDYIATGHLSKLAFVAGVIHAFFNILWFMDGRMVDFDSDLKYGKITTPIFMRKHDINWNVTDVYFILAACVFDFGMLYGYTIAYIAFALLVGYFVFTAVFTPDFYKTFKHSRDEYVKMRLIGMRLTVINAVIISLWLIYQRVYIV